MKDDFSSVKVGDKVYVVSGDWRFTSYREATVDKAHKLHIIVGHKKFRRDSGREVGDWNSNRLRLPSDELTEEMNKHKAKQMQDRMRDECRHFTWSVASDEIIAKVHAIITAAASARERGEG